MGSSNAATGSALRWVVALVAVIGVAISGCQDDPLSPDPLTPTPVGSDSLTASSDCVFDFLTNRWRCSGPLVPLDPPPAKAWVYATHPWSASYAPEAKYQNNSAGGTNTVRRLGTGRYRVTLPGISGTGGIVHVTAVRGNHQCIPQSWLPSGADMIVMVQCRRPTGSVMDGQFTMLFYRERGRSFRRAAYGVVDASSIVREDPVRRPVTEGWSSSGVPIMVRGEDGQSRYPLWFGGNMARPALTLVTATGGRGYCSGRNPSNPIGATCNWSVTQFAVSAMENPNIAGLNRRGAYVSYMARDRRDAQPFGVDCYERPGYNSTGAANEVCSGGGLGRILVKFPGIRDLTESVVIVSIGDAIAGAQYCNLDSWFRGTSTETWVLIHCFNRDGRPELPNYVNGSVALFTGAGSGPN